MPKRRKSRIYWRGGRGWADFRDFADVGGRREALKPDGDDHATDDRAVARVLADRRLAELKQLRRQRAILGESAAATTLEAYAAYHLVQKKRSGRVTDGWLDQAENYLERAVEYFGAQRPLMSITVAHVLDWAEVVKETVRGPGGDPASPGTVRHHLNALSNLYQRAKSENLVAGNYNPVSAIMRGEKPTGRRQEAAFLEQHEAAALMAAARRVKSKRPDIACPFLPELIATLLLTGGRKAEVLGLEVDDVSFERKTVSFSPNQWRRLKTAHSIRTVPLWPQLEAILGPYIMPADRTPRSGLLFPSTNRAGATIMVRDFRKALAVVAKAAKLDTARITPKVFRHTYCAARLQSLDNGQPVSAWTVKTELGHGSLAMVERVYGHLGQTRDRTEGVEYLPKVGEEAVT